MTVLKAKIGGTFQPVLSGYASNVYLGPDPPTDPNVEFWVDTDATLPVVPWIPMTLLNTWTVLGGVNDATTAYRKIGDIVYLRGSIKKATPVTSPGSSICATLPAGYRPAGNVDIAATAYGSDAVGGFGRVQVVPAGDIYVVAGAGMLNPHGMTLFNGSFSVTP